MMKEKNVLELMALAVEVNIHGGKKHRNADGKLHRLFGPAVIYSDGDETWYWRGMWHRVGGPASWAGHYYLFGKAHSKDAYDLECVNKTMPRWKEYDAELQQYE